MWRCSCSSCCLSVFDLSSQFDELLVGRWRRRLLYRDQHALGYPRPRVICRAGEGGAVQHPSPAHCRQRIPWATRATGAEAEAGVYRQRRRRSGLARAAAAGPPVRDRYPPHPRGAVPRRVSAPRLPEMAGLRFVGDLVAVVGQFDQPTPHRVPQAWGTTRRSACQKPVALSLRPTRSAS